MKDKLFGLSFFGFIMASSLNLMIKSSLFLSIPLPITLIVLILSFYIPFYITHLTNKFNNYIYLSMGIVFYIIMSAIPLESLAILFINNPEVYKGLYTTAHFLSSKTIREFFIWGFNYTLGLGTLGPLAYQIILYSLTSLSIGIYFCGVLKNRKLMLYLAFPVVFFYLQWLRYIDNALILFNFYIIGFVGCYLTVDFNKRVKLLNKRQDIEYKFYSYKGLASTGFIVITTLVLITNITINLFYISGINYKISQRLPAVLNLRSGEDRKISYSPFSNDLGGSIEQDNTLIMIVKSNKPNLYLRGRVKEIYTGYTWNKVRTNYFKAKDSLYDNKILFKDSENKVTITIYPQNKGDTTIYAPYLPTSINMNKKVFYNDSFEMYFKKGILNLGEISYQVTSIIPRYDDKKKEYNVLDTRKIDKSVYLQLPKNLPKRVVQLAQRITNDYDREIDKMKALEAYLRENYEYSLIVSDIPERRDFVDYFLFEDKKGYCTYYASALAVMGRAIGIPTRYVEGFILPEGEKGLYKITGDRAHAWVEAYIDQVGWISFEPTSVFPIGEDEGQRIQEQEASVIREGNSDSYEELKRRLEEESNLIAPDGDYSYEPSNKDYSFIKWIGLSILLLLFVGLALRILYQFINNKIIFSRGSNKKRIIKMYYAIASMYWNLDKDVVMGPPYDLLRIIQKNLLDKDINDDIINIVNKALYSKEDMSQEDLETIWSFKSNVEEALIKRIGRVKYYFSKYIAGSIYKGIVKANS